MKEMYSVFSLKFWSCYIIQCRPYLLFISGISGLAGISISEMASFNNYKFWIAFLPLFLGYGFGQALTDTWQTDTDALSAPYRPLSKGIISKKSVRLVSLIGLTICCILLVYLNIWNIIFGFLSVIGLATYTFFKRNYWFIGPVYNAWIVALLPLMGFLSISGLGIKSLYDSQLLMVCLLSFISYTNFVIMGYLKDISSDRSTNYKTFAVIFGWNKTVWLGDIIVILSSIIIFSIVNSPFGYTAALIATILAIIGQLHAHLIKIKKEQNASFSIIMTVRSLILWHCGLILDNQPNWWIHLMIFYLLFEIFLYSRPSKFQI